MKSAISALFARGLAFAMVVAALSTSASAFDPISTPEIDPSSMVGAMTLLSAGALMFTARRRSK